MTHTHTVFSLIFKTKDDSDDGELVIMKKNDRKDILFKLVYTVYINSSRRSWRLKFRTDNMLYFEDSYYDIGVNKN